MNELTRQSICISNLLLLFGAFLVLVDEVQADNARPNVVYFLADDMGFADTSAYLNVNPAGTRTVTQALHTPNIEQLAREGMRFTNVHASSTWCSASRYGIIAGRHSYRTYLKERGVMSTSREAPMIEKERSTIGTLMQNAGYRTAAIGKWHIGMSTVNSNGETTNGLYAIDYSATITDAPIHHGFDYSYGMRGNSGWKVHFENDRFVDVDGNLITTPDFASASSTWNQEKLDERTLNAALNFLDDHMANHSTDPFFLYYAPQSNHKPYVPPSEMNGVPIAGQGMLIDTEGNLTRPVPTSKSYDKRADLVYQNDVAIGQLLDKLSDPNGDGSSADSVVDNTIIVFTSDHGSDQGGGNISHAGMRGAKAFLWEGGHRVPTIIKWAGHTPAGAINSQPISLIDTYGTLAELTGQQLGFGEAEDSGSFAAVLEGNPIPQSNPIVSFAHHTIVAKDDDHSSSTKPLVERETFAWLSITDGDWKLIIDDNLVNPYGSTAPEMGSPNPVFLYNLAVDKHEDVNLVNDSAHADKVADLSEQLLRFHNRGFTREIERSLPGALVKDDGQGRLRDDLDGAVGFEFTVSTDDLMVESLGMWDDGAGDIAGANDGPTDGTPDGFSASHVVRLFDSSTQQEIAALTLEAGVDPTTFVEGEYRYGDLSIPVILTAGSTYALTVSTLSGDGDLLHNFAPFTGSSPLASSYIDNLNTVYDLTDGSYPSDLTGNLDIYKYRMFGGPTAYFSVVPEPNGFLLMIVGSSLIVFCRGRRCPRTCRSM